jgi:hypothetical protein
MKGRLIALREISAPDEAAWRELAARSLEPNPLFEPDCLIPAARHQLGGEEMRLLVAEDRSCFHACVPLVRVPRWGRLRLPVVTSHVRRMTYLGTPLIAPEQGYAAAIALLSALVQGRHDWRAGFLELAWVADGGPVGSLLREAASELHLPFFVHEEFERGLLVRRNESVGRDRVPGQTAGELRRRRRRLAERLGGELCFADRGTDPAGPTTYLDIESSGRKMANGVAVRAVPGEEGYFLEMCRRFARSDRLRLPALVGGGTTVAMQVWIQGSEGMFMIKNSYDATYRRYGPGVQLHLSASEHFLQGTDASWIDTCTYGGNELLLDLYPDRRRICSYLIALGSRRDGFMLGSYRALRATKALYGRSLRSPTPSGRPSPTGTRLS